MHGSADGSVPDLGRERATLRAGALALSLALLAAGCASGPTARGPTGVYQKGGARSPVRAKRVPRPAAPEAGRAAPGPPSYETRPAPRAAAPKRLPSELAGAYLGRIEVAGSERLFTLDLDPEGEALLTETGPSGEAATWRGRWQATSGALEATWEAVPGRVAPPLTWSPSGSELVPRTWDVAVWGSAGVPLSRWEASREPDPGCRWRPFADGRIGVRLLVQQCPDEAFRLEVDGERLVALADGEPAEYGAALLEVFEKPAPQAVAAAIRQRFVPRLLRRARKDCVVVPSRLVDSAGSSAGDGREIWELVPNPQYRADTTHWRATEPAATVCGPYGEQLEPAYFQYHPAESRTRYLFLRLGSDVPPFDESSVELLF